jgi:methylphosphotriester-DNA--protein-cysteine methyltransferase
MGYPRTNLQLDSLLLFIFRLISIDLKAGINTDMPLWLSKAIREYKTPDHFREGSRGFVGLCERNIDYVNRTIQKHLGKSLTALVNEIKMHFAATQLAITNTPIKSICNDCGFKNVGHFYKTFQSYYGLTPSAYRKINQTVV